MPKTHAQIMIGAKVMGITSRQLDLIEAAKKAPDVATAPPQKGEYWLLKPTAPDQERVVGECVGLGSELGWAIWYSTNSLPMAAFRAIRRVELEQAA